MRQHIYGVSGPSQRKRRNRRGGRGRKVSGTRPGARSAARGPEDVLKTLWCELSPNWKLLRVLLWFFTSEHKVVINTHKYECNCVSCLFVGMYWCVLETSLVCSVKFSLVRGHMSSKPFIAFKWKSPLTCHVSVRSGISHVASGR